MIKRHVRLCQNVSKYSAQIDLDVTQVPSTRSAKSGLHILKKKMCVNTTQRVSCWLTFNATLHHYKDQPPTRFRERSVSFRDAVNIWVYVLSTDQEMVPATNATHAHAQVFAVNDELQSHKALAQSTLYASCLCCSRTDCHSYQQQYCSLTYSQQSPHRARHPPPLGGVIS